MERHTKIEFLLIVLLFVTASSYAQDYNVKEVTSEDLIGRWIEEERYAIDNSTENIVKYPLVYIFYDDMKFTLGEQTEGMVVFGISGHYELENGCMKMWYRNYLVGVNDSLKERTMNSKILSMTKDKIEVEITESPYKSYRAIFRREG